MKIIRAKQAKVHSAYFVQRDNRGIIAKDFTKGKVPLRCDVLFAQPSYYTTYKTSQREDFALLLCRLRQRNVLKCLLLGKHD